MKIGFYLENRKIWNVDFSRPELGNPGCGATEFLFSALPYYLIKFQSQTLSPIIFANNVELLPDNVPAVRVEDVCDAARCAKQEECAFFIYRPRRHIESELLALLNRLQLSTIAWAQLTPTMPYLRQMAFSPYLKAIVCVGHEQYDLIQDSPCHEKLTYIENSLDVDGFQPFPLPEKEPGLVVYLGALVPQKGFHLLAKVWMRILGRHPSARLAVIGTGSLYDSDARLGPWGIAEQSYEEKHIIPYLIDKNGRLHPSVEFMGKLGAKKKEILARAIVGVPNPTGQTETCCVSALEFQACGTAVVSGAYYGLLDTVRHGETGLLGRSEEDLVANICELLEDPSKAQKMGENGTWFIRERYGFARASGEWAELFDRLRNDHGPKRFPFKRNFYKHSKWLIVLNRQLQIRLGSFIKWPTIVELKEMMFKWFSSLRKR